MSKSICQIVTLLPPSRDGVADGVIKLHSLLTRNGKSAFVITSEDQKKQPGIIPLVKKWSFSSWFTILHTLRRLGITTVLIHYPSTRYKRYISLSFFPLFLFLNGVKTVLYMHEYCEYSWLGKIRILLFTGLSTKVITTDTPNYFALKKWFFLRKKVFKLPVCSNFVEDVDDFDCCHLTDEMQKPYNKIRILYFGLIRAGKGLQTILRVFEDNEIAKKFSLHITGDLPAMAGMSDKKLFEIVQTQRAWKYHGYLSFKELQSMFHETDLVLLPFETGLTERRGSFMVSASFGKTVLTTKPTHQIDNLVHKSNVLFLNDNDELTLHDMLLEVAEMKPSELENIGKNAKKWYFTNFGDDVFISKLISILDHE